MVRNALVHPIRRIVLAGILLSLVSAVAFAQPAYELNLTSGHPFVAPESMHDCTVDPDGVVSNCSFETGDFTDWVLTDAAVPFLPAGVFPGGQYIGYGFFTSAPTQGAQSMLNGFDASGPDVIELAQDVTIPAGGGATLEFDYRGAWNMTFGATLDRTFEVEVQPAGGGAPMQTDLILTAPAGDTTLDTGPQSAVVDLSAFQGQSVRVALRWDIPEAFTGPGFFEVDNVQIAIDPDQPVIEIPTLSQVGLAVLIASLMIGAIFLLRRRA